MKKRDKNILLGLFIVGIILAIAYFGDFKTFALVDHISSYSTSSFLLSKSDNSYTFKQTFSSTTTRSGCEGSPTLELNELTMAGTNNDYLFNGDILLNYNIQLKKFNATNVELSGITAISDRCGVAKNEPFTIENLYAECFVIKTDPFLSDTSGRLQCNYYGIVKSTSGIPIHITGPSSGEATVEILKNGFECTPTQLSLCEINEKCESNQCVDGQITVYRIQGNTCTSHTILSSNKLSTDYDSLIECQNNIIIEPLKPPPKGFIGLLQQINDWIADFFKGIFGLSITGATNIEPNTVQTYNINLTTQIPDSDYSDGKYQIQYANWVLVDSGNNIKQQGIWEEIKGNYKKDVTITTPLNIGDYILIGVITQYDMTYNFTTKIWKTGEEMIVNKAGIDLQNKYTVIAPTKPSPGGFGKLLQSLKNFFCNNLGWFC